MSILPPSPFVDSGASHPAAPDEAAASFAPTPVAATFAEPSITMEVRTETPAATAEHDVAGDFDGPDIPLAELVRRGFDEEGFLNDLEPLPAFLGAPSQEYLKANDLMPVLHALAGH